MYCRKRRRHQYWWYSCYLQLLLLLAVVSCAKDSAANTYIGAAHFNLQTAARAAKQWIVQENRQETLGTIVVIHHRLDDCFMGSLKPAHVCLHQACYVSYARSSAGLCDPLVTFCLAAQRVCHCRAVHGDTPHVIACLFVLANTIMTAAALNPC
jgi:hypothetical protein